MKTPIINAFPPNIAAIRAKFNIAGRGVVFAYGSAIYNPVGKELPQSIIRHEEVHLREQKGDPEEWWDRYIKDKAFRLEQELMAHRMEYITMLQELNFPGRPARRRLVRFIAKKLASPIYGPMIDIDNAKRLLNGNNAIA